MHADVHKVVSLVERLADWGMDLENMIFVKSRQLCRQFCPGRRVVIIGERMTHDGNAVGIQASNALEKLDSRADII